MGGKNTNTDMSRRGNHIIFGGLMMILIAAERLAAIPFCGSLSGHEMRDLFE
jgi:hypothetical protein